MKKAIVTLAIGEEHQILARTTQPLMRAYAEKVGAEFYCISERTGDYSIPWEKCALFDLLGAEYDRVIYLDNDILVRPDCPDLFELVPETHLGAFDEGYFLPREDALRLGMKQYGCPNLPWKGQYLNTGVMVASRQHRHMFRHPDEHIDNFWEQTYFNIVAMVNRYDVMNIRYEMNFMPALMEITGLPMESARIAHLAGQYPGIANGLAQEIIHNWEEAAPDYKFPRKVWLDFAGGLGDVIDAEPVLRHTLAHVFPDDDIRITSPWPRVFMGQCDKPLLYGMGNPFDPDMPLHLESRPPEGSGIWGTLTHVTSNATDFASIAMLHQQLPFKDKRPHLVIFDDDRAEVDALAAGFPLEQSILIHAGRTWESRTFPVEWWQQIIDGISAAGVPVVLCGLQGEIHGVLPVECPANGLDLRNRTSMGAMFELVRRCPCLVSNDSSPVHIAAPFDNYIVLIPSARHPDLVLPWRSDTLYWRAAAPHKKLTLTDISTQPCEFYGTHANGAPKGPWADYLPEAAEVIAAALAGRDEVLT